MVTKGFDGNDRGRAEAAVDLLVREGVLLAAKNGTTISVSPKWVPQVRKFLGGGPMDDAAVDDWSSG
jgi:hypothetical protein